MSRFPLLSLPLVSLSDTLKCMNAIEMFTLAHCSKKMIDKIKLSGSPKFRLSVNLGTNIIHINDDYCFVVYESSSSRNGIIGRRHFKFESKKLRIPVALYFRRENVLSSFWNDTFVGVKEIAFQLTKIFGCKIDSFDTGYDLSVGKFRSIVGEIVKNQDEIRNLTIHTNDITGDNLKWTLDSIKVTEELYLDVRASEAFNYNLKTIPKFLNIGFSSWFTVKNLLSSDSCVVIYLNFSNLTNQDLEVFIKLWKAGKFSKLEYLYVGGFHLNEQEPIDGLQQMKIANNSAIRRKEINGKQYSIKGGVDIKRNDGVMGTFKQYDSCFKLLVWQN